jgi:hypothetical protein
MNFWQTSSLPYTAAQNSGIRPYSSRALGRHPIIRANRQLRCGVSPTQCVSKHIYGASNEDLGCKDIFLTPSASTFSKVLVASSNRLSLILCEHVPSMERLILVIRVNLVSVVHALKTVISIRKSRTCVDVPYDPYAAAVAKDHIIEWFALHMFDLGTQHHVYLYTPQSQIFLPSTAR